MVAVVLSWSAEHRLDSLERSSRKSERSVLRAVERLVPILKQNPHHGQHVAKRLFPQAYLSAGVSILFRVPLPSFWRLLYTFREERGEQAVLILDILSHAEYDALFGYRKK
ncbi:hypothetical protein GOV07_02990 [Candidatus Woesearchaeota archaeon]|nr:hypothetical protein [Candidatus Woesearchaeota archaeon]